ncbi:ABC transporter ATP-binding protein [Glycomyces harbinensis]|uniref:ATP-binding cassette, subfamily C n=1 Tax=Glycomyces harbinensis TaxID=58114 RepID=A0A1G7BHP8_9ACTN|nr:ABC transporter ATP-binding protein [Glycomyces harbinensis]SDE25966.1 ATP-binding cassette, subfamily C [Glycomyces harbinensis]
MSDHGTREALPLADAAQVRAEVRLALKGGTWKVVGVVALLTLGAAAGLVTPWALGSLVDAVANSEGAERIWWIAGAIAAGSLVAAIADGVGQVGATRLVERVLASTRERMVARGLALPRAALERAGAGDLVSRSGDDVNVVAEAAPLVVPAVAGSAFSIAMTVVGMAVLDWRFAVAAVLLVAPVHALTLNWHRKTAPDVYEAERAAMAHRAHHLLASLRGIETVHAFGLSRPHGKRIAAVSWAVAQWSVRAQTVVNGFFARLNFAEFLGMGSILVVGFWLVREGQGTVGAATTAMLFFLRLFDPINRLMIVVDDLQSALASMRRIVGVIGADRFKAPEHTEPESDAAAEVEALDFAYTPGHPVLRGIDFRIGPKETVALVGSSGAGKSTLAALIAGVLEPDAGRVSVAAREGGPAVALVTQEVHVFDGTLRENLDLVRPGATDDELEAALRRVGAESLLALADGLDTGIGDRGLELTPAQAQALALARVVLLDPRLAVLDEATAEAGSADSAALDGAAAAALEGRAGLLVAHRLDQAAKADRIVVMEHGRIVEEGTHEGLAAADGPYARAWSLWTRGRS